MNLIDPFIVYTNDPSMFKLWSYFLMFFKKAPC